MCLWMILSKKIRKKVELVNSNRYSFKLSRKVNQKESSHDQHPVIIITEIAAIREINYPTSVDSFRNGLRIGGLVETIVIRLPTQPEISTNPGLDPKRRKKVERIKKRCSVLCV